LFFPGVPFPLVFPRRPLPPSNPAGAHRVVRLRSWNEGKFGGCVCNT
jgi:hypothetical protein